VSRPHDAAQKVPTCRRKIGGGERSRTADGGLAASVGGALSSQLDAIVLHSPRFCADHAKPHRSVLRRG
jgi:hypothetical protein